MILYNYSLQILVMHIEPNKIGAQHCIDSQYCTVYTLTKYVKQFLLQNSSYNNTPQSLFHISNIMFCPTRLENSQILPYFCLTHLCL